MTRYKFSKKEYIASIAALLFIHNAAGGGISLAASDISGVTGSAITGGTQYDITPSSILNDTGFRHYENFNLSQGDVANLIYQNNMSKFVNLVDNTIYIHGILNTLSSNGSFYNGSAIFVSPNGMVVGASGVLNVGSLTAIVPTPSNYVSYLYNSMGNDEAKSAASVLKITTTGYDTDITLENLKNLTSDADISIEGKIFARGDVNLYAKNISVVGDSTNQAAIFAGIPSDYDIKMETLAQANTIFNELVSTNVKNGTGFSRDNNGNIVISAKSIKTSDTSNVDNINDNSASVNINNAVITGQNVTVSAVSEVTYEEEDASSSFGYVGDLLESLTDISDITSSDYLGARAKATVDIGENTQIEAEKDIKVTSSATASTSIESGEAENLIYAGAQTVSNITVGSGANLEAGNDINISAASHNVLEIETEADINVSSLPEFGFSFVQAVIDADTQANIENGAVLTSGNDVNVTAYNITGDSTSVETEVKLKSDGNNGTATDSGIAVNLLFKDTNINTQAIVDGTVTAGNNVSVNAQNLHVENSKSETSVEPIDDNDVTSRISENARTKLISLLSSKISGISDTLSSIANVSSAVPSVSVSLVDNTTNLTATAQVGKNAKITAVNDVTVNANTIDLTQNSSTASVEDSNSTVAPGVAVILNSQTINTNAIIQDGDENSHATINAGGNLNVNATLEQPYGDSLIDFAVGGYNLITGGNWDYTGFSNLISDLQDENSDIRQSISDVEYSFGNIDTSTLGVSSFFNNWAQSVSESEDGIGISASIIVTDTVNNTLARIGDSAVVTAATVNINAANKIYQFNCAGDMTKLWSLIGASGKSGIGGNILIESVESSAKAQIGDNAIITAKGDSEDNDINIQAANEQNFVTFVITGVKSSSKDTSVSISGSTIIQDVGGITEASVGASELTADSLNIKAGEAEIKYADDVETNTESIELSDTTNKISDGISNLIVSGALSISKTSGSAVAAGAAVNVSEFSREISSFIADGANITLADTLSVVADSETASLNIALAGAFTGGVSMDSSSSSSSEQGKISQFTSKLSSLKDKLLDKVTTLGGLLDVASYTDTGKVDSNGNAIVTSGGVEYSTNSEGVYQAADGTTLKDSSGNAVKAQASLGSDSTSSSLTSSSTSLSNASAAQSNLNAAAAGAVNVQINDSTVTAKIGAANITVGNSVNVEASQETSTLNIGGGVAKGSTVGAGAAVNFIDNANQTTASIEGAKIIYTAQNTTSLNVKAEENNDNIQVALGVGATTSDPNNSSTSAAIGGSFNNDILENTVSAQIKDTTVENKDSSLSSTVITVDAENHSTSYKGAGALSVSSTSGSSVGAGIASNLNVINKTTYAGIDNSQLNNISSVGVYANKDSSKKTETLVSVGVAGSVVTGGSSSYTFDGALGTDIINNNITAQIINGTSISSGSSIDVIANNYLSNMNITGAIGFSLASGGGGIGVGSVVSVLNNDITAKIDASSITAQSGGISVKAANVEDLDFYAANLGIQSSGTSIDANGIVNVSRSNILAEVINSEITTVAGNLDVLSSYNADVYGVTAVVSGSNSGLAFGANVLSNTFINNNTAKITGSTLDITGDVSVIADSDEIINVAPATVAVTVSGSAAAAANIGVNVLSNSTNAYIDGGTISSNDIIVSAADDTISRSRGGTLAASGGTAAVGGSILADVYLKDVNSYIDNVTITNGGDISVNASAENIFGSDDTTSITASTLASSITDGTYDVSSVLDFADWDMTFDVSGSNTAAISGSIISKTVVNDVNAYLGSGVVIQEAGDISVAASNETSIAAVIGNVSVSGTAAVGGSLFMSVNTSSVNAGIKEGAQIGTVSSVGNIDIDALSTQDYYTIDFVVGASGTTAVNGALTSHVIVNDTNAYIDKGVTINSKDISVQADDTLNIEALNLAVSGSGTASVGGIANVNVFNNTVSSVIGQNTDSNTDVSGSINANSINVNAHSAQDYQANVLMVAGSGAAAVSGVAISNTMATNVIAGIEEITINADDINISAENAYNEKHKDQTTGVQYLTDSSSLSTDDLTASDLIPLVSVLNISGSGAAAITGTLVNNNVITTVDSYVKNADITTDNGLNLNANSLMTTYDAVMGVAGSAYASVAATGVVNIYAGSTTSEIANSTISGNVALDSTDKFNLNTIIFTAAGSGTGAAITAVTNTNTIVNDVIASITGSTISNASTVSVNSSNNITISDIIAAGSGTGVGAAVNFVPINNIFVGNTKSYIDSTSIDGAETAVEAENNINTISVVMGVAGSGIGADVSGYALTNVFDNDLDSYITNSTLTNSLGTSVSAVSDLDMNGYIVSGGITGTGASVIINAITNVVNNNMNSYITNSSISGGNINVNSYQHSDIFSTTLAANATGAGATSAVNSIINILTNNAQSYIYNTSTDEAGSIAVATETENDIENINYGVSGSGTGVAASANSLVNVIENTGYSYIDAQSQTMSATGNISVTSADNLLMSNTMGMLAASGSVAAGANVNVNVLNNAVKSEVLSNTDGLIKTTGGVSVSSSSVMALEETVATASAGLGAGIAGTVIVNSIGGKYVQSDSSLNDAGIDEAIESANSNYDDTAGTLTYEKDGETVSLSKSLSLTGSSGAKEGTVANISANLEAENDINITAENTVKGYDSDTLELTNATAAAGSVAAASVGVIVNDMNYNTKASISGGSVVSNSDVNVQASSTVKADIDTISATISGIVGIGGNVGYFNNSAVTSAIIDSAKVEGDTINVAATSVDDIDVNVISASVGYVSANVSVAISETSNEVNALIKGSNVDIDANTLNVTASNTSSLSSELDSLQAGSYTFSAVVNRSESNAITKALINATGDITTVESLNIIAQSGGISASSTMKLGNIAALNLSATEQGAFVNSEFYSGLNNNNLTVTNGGKTTILSGVDSSDNSSAAEMSAVVTVDKASVTLATGSYTLLNAVVGAISDAKSVAKKHTADSMYIASMLDRSAVIESASNNIGAVVLGAMQMNSDISGSNTITIAGDNEIKGAINVLLNDDSSTSTSMINGSISLVSVDVNSMKSVIETATTVDISGTLAMDSLTIDSNVNKTAFTTVESKSLGLISAKSLSITTSAQGDSTVNFSANATNTDYKNAVEINSNSTNSVQSIQSDNSVALLALKEGTTTTNLTASNTVNFDGAAIASTGDFDVSINNENRYSIKKTSSSGGVVVFTGDELVNNIKSEAEISIKDSNVTANNAYMSAEAFLGNVDDEEITYTIGISGGIVKDDTTITNTVEQSSNINFVNSSVNATENMDISIITDSSFAQKIESDGSGFTSKNVATSNLTVTNNNTLSIDKNSSLSADTVDISLDSSNKLSSKVDVDVSHFGGRDPGAYSYITLTVNNNIDNQGTITADSLAQFDFMKNSINTLTQYSSVVVEAAIATANAGGGLTYNSNNSLNVASGASIVSGKDVTANYSNGKNSLNSTIYSKKISRVLFGIPIPKTSTSSSITKNYSNSLNLDGEIIAGASSQKYMYIDKDGNIDYNTLQGFSSDEYSIVDAVSLTGEELTANTIASLESKIASMEEKLAKLQSSAETYEDQISNYNDVLTELNEILSVLGSEYSTSSFMTSDSVSAAIKSNISSAVVGDGDAQVSSTLFESIYDGYAAYITNLYEETETTSANLADITSFESYLKTFTYETVDQQGNKVDTNLTTAQITTLTNAYNEYENAVKSEGYFSTYTTGGKTYVIIDSQEDYNTIKTSLQSSVDNLTTLITSLTESKENISQSIDTVNYNILNYEVQIEYLKENPLSALSIDHSAIEFEDLITHNSTIELNGLKQNEITGSGKFEVLTPELVVENYSNRDLVFKNINLSTPTSGLYIDGVSYSSYLNSGKPVNDKVYYVSDNDDNPYEVSISTYYDYNNSLAKAVSSAITFGGYIQTAGSFNVLNENGDINFSSFITAEDKSILAPQGNITYDASSSTLTLNDGDAMIAGKDITINASSVVIDGLVQAGLGDRTITITDSMLSNLIVDPSTGEQNMVDIGSTNGTAYLNLTDNIKVLYVNGQILVFNLEHEGGNVTVNGEVSGSGNVNYTDGYNNITIVNETNSELIVNSISNNRNNGSFTYTSGSTDDLTVFNLGHNSAETEITSVGAVTIANTIENGLTDDETETILSTLTISSDNGITVNALKNELGETIDTIAAAGDLTLENGQSGSVVISGDIDITDGDIEITNEGENIDISGAIEDVSGDILIANNGTGDITLAETGSIIADDGDISITNEGENIDISGTIEDISGDISIANNGTGDIILTDTGSITANDGDIEITNEGENIDISGTIEDVSGDISIANNGTGDITLTDTGSITANDGDISITNEGENIDISGTIEDVSGDISIANNGTGDITLTDTGSITADDGNIEVANEGESMTISGNITAQDGDIKISNEGGNDGILTINSSVTDKNGDIYIYNNGEGGTVLTGNANVSASGSDTSITIENTAGGITTTDNSVIENNSKTSGTANLIIKNTGDDGITLAGSILNILGDTEITNNNTNGGITFETTSDTTNNDGNIYISNNGENGIFVEGIINTDNQDIIITNSDSDIVIGEYTSTNDNYINAENGNIVISQINGDILNGITDEDTDNANQNQDLANPDKAYKTLIAASGNLTINVENGNVGSDTNALDGKESGFSINAETRDYTESINVSVNGVVNITASENDDDGALINVRAKDSDLNVGEITTDGNVMLTAADWKQADESPAPDNEEYYTGYSITNALNDADTANITGRNISVIASNNIGENNNKLTYNQLEDGTISALAENSIYLSSQGDNDNIWQMIAKRGNMDIDFTGNAEIREITAGKDLKLVSKGSNLTIYELGTTSNISDASDILYQHDGVSISSDGIVPETVEIKVLNTNESTKTEDGSTLNIYTAYVKGNDEDGADVTLRADNITAHAYDAASSIVPTEANPDGFNAQEDRLYSNDYTDSNSEKVLEAQGFNTYGDGGQLVFDIQGVSPEDVEEAGASVDSRTYNAQNPQTTLSEFTNPDAFDETVYKANSVTLSLNSSDNSPTDNRGMLITNLYADNAYIDTKDLNLDVIDAYITNYAEFLNGNRDGDLGGHYVSNDYRWLAIVDNDYSRNITNLYGVPVSSQLYTALTGSFYLHLGNTITQQTKSPVVYYNSYNSVNAPSTENSFFRITYKDDKIQKTTTEPGFKDIDKDTHIKTKREYIRFYVVDNDEQEDGFINVSYDKSDKDGKRIISIEDISRGGLLVVHDGSLKLKEKFTINLTYNDIQVSPDVMVVRLDSSNRAGLKFVNLDDATAAKILYMNMSIETDNRRNMQISQR